LLQGQPAAYTNNAVIKELSMKALPHPFYLSPLKQSNYHVFELLRVVIYGTHFHTDDEVHSVLKTVKKTFEGKTIFI
jgi:hypothetical protein